MISAMFKKEDRSPWEGVDMKFPWTAVAQQECFPLARAFLTLEQAHLAEAP